MLFAGRHLQTEIQRDPIQHSEHQPARSQGSDHHRSSAGHHLPAHLCGAKLLLLSPSHDLHHHPECSALLPGVLHHPALLLPQQRGLHDDQAPLGRLAGYKQYRPRTKLCQELHCHAGHVQRLWQHRQEEILPRLPHRHHLHQHRGPPRHPGHRALQPLLQGSEDLRFPGDDARSTQSLQTAWRAPGPSARPGAEYVTTEEESWSGLRCGARQVFIPAKHKPLQSRLFGFNWGVK